VDDATATLTFEITPDDDPLTLSPLAPLSLLDGQAVSLDMAAFVQDPDNDPVVYAATGLPVGLTLDSVTGLLSGTVDSAASQGGPYVVNFSADDTNGSVVAGSFTITVTNTVPVGTPQIMPLPEGSPFVISVAAVVADTDGDVLTYTVTGLPVWATFDAGAGTISGTPPLDGSLSAPALVTVSADDGEGGVASAIVTLAPQNMAPVLVSPLADLVRDEGAAVNLNLSAFFDDGGDDGDVLVYAVNGLPSGLTFNATTGRISGAPDAGTGRASAYAIDVTVSDGQGGLLSERFNLSVTPPASAVEGTSDFVRSVDDGLTSFETIETILKRKDVTLSETEKEELTTLLEKSGPMPKALTQSIDDTITVSKAVASAGDPQQSSNIGDADDAAEREQENEAQTSEQIVQSSVESRLSKIAATFVSSDGKVFMAIRDTFDPAVDGAVTELEVKGERGAPLPENVKLLNPRFANISAPANGKPLVLELHVTVSDGMKLIKRVEVQPAELAQTETGGLRRAL
ncbi:MAG: putative Ig domain-containing protein, partial [Pseudomonadota bacterium]